MKQKKSKLRYFLILLSIIGIILYAYHPMIEDKAHSLSLIDIICVNSFLTMQDGKLNAKPNEETQFYVMLDILKNKDQDTSMEEIISHFPDKYMEDYFAILVLYEENNQYVNARYITNFSVPFTTQLNKNQRAQAENIILSFFNNNREQDGIKYCYNLMHYCAQTGHLIDFCTTTDYSYRDYDNYADYADTAYDDHSSYLDYYDTYGYNDTEEEDDPYSIFDRSDGETPYDRGFEEGYSSDNVFDNFHGQEENYNSSYMDGYSDGLWESYIDDNTFEPDLDSYGDTFDEYYGDFLYESYDEYYDDYVYDDYYEDDFYDY